MNKYLQMIKYRLMEYNLSPDAFYKLISSHDNLWKTKPSSHVSAYDP